MLLLLFVTAIVFVYDYHPTAETLASKHFSNPQIPNGYASPYNLDGAARPFSAGKGMYRYLSPQQEAMPLMFERGL